MALKTKLLITERKAVWDALQKTEKDVEDAIAEIKNWFQAQKHLPEIPCDEIIESFLVTNKFNMEKTREKLDMYYTIRSLLPDVFREGNPKNPCMKKISKVVWLFPLPILTKDLHRVIVLKFVGDPSDFNANHFLAHQQNINEIRLHEETNMGDIVIVDFKDIRLGHVFKFSFFHIRTAFIILKKVFSNRIKGVYIINAPYYIHSVIRIVKSLMIQKLAERFFVYRDLGDVPKVIPKEILPKDFGGEEMSMEELKDLWLEKLDEYQERFDKLDTLEVKEDLRLSHSKKGNNYG